MLVHKPKPNRGWKPEGTATWQRAEAARRALLAYMNEHGSGQCPGCQGSGVVLVRTPEGVRAPWGAVRVWLLPVVCPHCRPEDWER